MTKTHSGRIIAYPTVRRGLVALAGFCLGSLPVLLLLVADWWRGGFITYLVSELPYALLGGLLHRLHIFERPAQEALYCLTFASLSVTLAFLMAVPLLRRGYRIFSYALIVGCLLSGIVSSLFQGWRIML